MAIEFIDLLDVLEIHETLLAAYGGKSGIRDVWFVAIGFGHA